MSSLKRIWVVFCVVALVAACGGVEDPTESRPDPVQLGGKADVPDWLQPQSKLLGCGALLDPTFPPIGGPVIFGALDDKVHQQLNGSFSGLDSAHLYPLWADAGKKVKLSFTADYPAHLGAAIAVYNLKGDRLLIDRNVDENQASVELVPDSDGIYLVAVYSVAWWATGSYQLVVDCSPAPVPGPICSPTGPIDALCGTICPDGYEVVNGEVTCSCCAPKICGGIAGFLCPAGKKCKLDGDYPDASGKCVDADYCDVAADCKNLAMPMHCIGAYRCESNKCVFRCEWEGECHELNEMQCNVRSDCEWTTTPGFPGPISMCREKNAQPQCYVGGCSGQICSPIQGVVSTCEWRAEYGCLKLSECGNFGPNGGCGWKQTPDYLACMASL